MTSTWGLLPALSVTMALGIAIVTVAFAGARVAEPWALAGFWLGLLVLFVPTAARILHIGSSRWERVGLVLFLAMGLYVVKMVHSPAGFTFYDELQHWRTLVDMDATQRLFVENPLLRTSPLFPGMEIAAQSLMSLAGLTPFASGLVIVGVAKAVLVLGVFLMFEAAVRSTRVAAAGSLIYIANPSFLFFDGQFAYESFALPLSVLLLYALASRDRLPITGRLGMTLIALLALAAVITSHHLTSYFLLGFLLAWAATRMVLRLRDGMGPGGMGLLALVGATAWAMLVATFTVSYLAGPVGNAIFGMIRLITREERGRELFRGATEASIVAPTWERLIGFAAVALILIAMPFGLWRIYRDHSTRSLAVVLGAMSVLYPASLTLRFTGTGAEAAARASASLFLAVGLVTALGLVARVVTRPSGRRLAAATAFCTIVFMGGVIVGWPPWNRLPGPYIVGANSRSIEQEGVAAAEWMLEMLGPNNRFVADRTNNLLIGSYGRQYSVWYQTAQLDLSPVYFAPEIGDFERALLAQGDVDYLVVDTRLTRELPQTGNYIDAAETRDTGPHKEPIALELIEKFDATAGALRVFDSGSIRIYDVSRIGR